MEPTQRAASEVLSPEMNGQRECYVTAERIWVHQLTGGGDDSMPDSLQRASAMTSKTEPSTAAVSAELYGGTLGVAHLFSRSAPFIRRQGRRFMGLGAFVLGDLAVAALASIIGGSIAELVVPTDSNVRVPLPPESTVVFFMILGSYVSWGLDPIKRLRLRIMGILAFMSVNALLTLPFFSAATTVKLTCLGALLLVFGHYVESLIRWILVRSRLWGVPTVLIGQASSQDLATALLAQPELGLRPVGFIDDRTDNSPPSQHSFLPILGHLGDSEKLSRDIEVALVSEKSLCPEDGATSLPDLPFAHIVLVPETSGRVVASGVPTQISGGVVGVDITRGIYKRQSLLIKRTLDLILSVPLLLIGIPIIMILVLAIKLIDPGPSLFRQQRVGQGGRTIEVFKLRTMYTDAENRLQELLAKDLAARLEWERYFKLSKDPRILPIIGSFIRRTSLDELPQLINVLIGTMSLVGPRPFPRYHINSFDHAFRDLRTSVPPGLTGFWQVSARSDGDLSVQKVQDSFYIQNWSIWLDLWILLQTLPAVVVGRGAR